MISACTSQPKNSKRRTDETPCPAATKVPGQLATEIRFEIPAPQIGRSISGDYYTAAGLEIKHNKLVESVIESRPDCFEVVR